MKTQILSEISYFYLWNSYFSEKKEANKQLLVEDILEIGRVVKDSFSGEVRFELFTDEKELIVSLPEREAWTLKAKSLSIGKETSTVGEQAVVLEKGREMWSVTEEVGRSQIVWNLMSQVREFKFYINFGGNNYKS